MKCPYCGGEMEKGSIQSNGSTLIFSTKEHPFIKLARQDDVQLARGLNAEAEAHRCKGCKKLVIDYA